MEMYNQMKKTNCPTAAWMVEIACAHLSDVTIYAHVPRRSSFSFSFVGSPALMACKAEGTAWKAELQAIKA